MLTNKQIVWLGVIGSIASIVGLFISLNSSQLLQLIQSPTQTQTSGTGNIQVGSIYGPVNFPTQPVVPAPLKTNEDPVQKSPDVALSELAKAIPSIAPEMVHIGRGCFFMGSPQNEKYRSGDDEKLHKVCVADFWIGKTEVTKGEFKIFVTETNYKTESEKDDANKSCYGWAGTNMQQDKKYNWRNPGFDQADNEPVVCVSWNDAKAYIAWLNFKTGKSYRLPTEAQWEYAARGKNSNGEVTSTTYYWGNDDDKACTYANVFDLATKKSIENEWTPFQCYDGFIFTASVGERNPNTLGLYDMIGNVWEWTCSEYDKDYSGKDLACIEELKENSKLVLRGGSWRNYIGRENRLRSAYRYGYEPTHNNADHGFRLALTEE